MSTFSDHDIKLAVAGRGIDIEPFNPAAVQPASYDLKLGNKFWRFKQPNSSAFNDYHDVSQIIDPLRSVADMMRSVHAEEFIDIKPQEMLLGVTAEKITLGDRVVARVEGKSSLGRIGLSVHITAGFIDPGFSGYITLEMYNCAPYPIRLRPGMWIGQLAFQSTITPCDVPYGTARDSRYTDQLSPEPVVSRIHQKKVA